MEGNKTINVTLGICAVLALAAICVARSEAKQKQGQKQAVDAQGAPVFKACSR
jgi:hypothetical protein